MISISAIQKSSTKILWAGPSSLFLPLSVLRLPKVNFPPLIGTIRILLSEPTIFCSYKIKFEFWEKEFSEAIARPNIKDEKI